MPDYRGMALAGTMAAEFDDAGFMALRNGLFTDQARITQIRELLVPAWKPGEKANEAMVLALETYREKRLAAEGRGEAAKAAHDFAVREARNVYNKAVKE